MRKKKIKAFYEKRKYSSGKNSTRPTKSTPSSSATRTTAGMQQYKISITITDGDQTLSTSGINIKRIDDEAEFPKVSGNSVSIMGKKQLGEVTFCLSKPGRKLKQVYIFPRMLLKLLSAPGFKIIDTLILK